MTLMKADLHVHSYHSGYASHLRFLRARDCYSSPFDVYRVAKARGMDLVCLTDHDSINGALEFLDRSPDAHDFIVGEEISCRVPDAPGLRVHLGAWGLTEAIHREVQRLRPNAFEAAQYLRQQQVFFAVNHLFLMYGDEMALARYIREMLAMAPALETRNGAAVAADNEFVAELAADPGVTGRRMAAVAGSDAHTLQWVGTTYTEAPARTREEFLTAIRDGRGTAGGRHSDVWRAASEIYGVVFNYWRALAGLERHDLTLRHRLAGTAFSIASLPVQMIPAAVAIILKTREARRVARWRREWAARPASAAVASPAA
jgi:predicted metal-dependent phosphoesterase TrpH